MKKLLQLNGIRKQAGVTIIISDKIDFKLNPSEETKENLYILLKGTIKQEDIIYNPQSNSGAHVFIKSYHLLELKTD